jgi:hypothetical protein
MSYIPKLSLAVAASTAIWISGIVDVAAAPVLTPVTFVPPVPLEAVPPSPGADYAWTLVSNVTNNTQFTLINDVGGNTLNKANWFGAAYQSFGPPSTIDPLNGFENTASIAVSTYELFNIHWLTPYNLQSSGGELIASCSFGLDWEYGRGEPASVTGNCVPNTPFQAIYKNTYPVNYTLDADQGFVYFVVSQQALSDSTPSPVPEPPGLLTLMFGLGITGIWLTRTRLYMKG